MEKDSNIRLLLFASLLVLTAINGIFYIYFIPPWQSPDEPTHFEYVQVLADSGNIFGTIEQDLPLQQEIIISMDRHRFWQYLGWPRPNPLPQTFKDVPFLRLSQAESQINRKPPLYYILASLIIRLLPEGSIYRNLYILRSFSLLLTIATIFTIYAGAKIVLPYDTAFPFICAGAVTFLPGFMQIGTSVSLDPLANLLSALFLLVMIKIQFQGCKLRLMISAFGISIFSIFVTYKCFSLIPILFVGIFLCYLSHYNRRVIWLKAMAMSIVFLLLFVIIYSSVIYFDPEVGSIVVGRLGRLYDKTGCLISGDIRLATYYYPWFNNEVFKSFWIKFGWAVYSVNDTYYLILKILSMISLLGIFILIIKATLIKSYIPSALFGSIILLIISAVTVLTAYYLHSGVGPRATAQGRHLYVSILAWSVLFVIGLRELVPKKLERLVYGNVVVIMFIFNAIVLFGYIIPVFRIS